MASATSEAVGGKDLYPCPPPFPWFESQEMLPGRSRRKKARYQRKRAIELWVNLMVCSLSHAASSLDVAPLRGRCGVKLNGHQRQMCDDLHRFASSLVRLGDDDASGCGLRLPAAEDRLSEVRSQLEKLDALPYAAQTKRFAQPSGAEAFAATKALPVVAERLSLPSRVSNFDPRPFLSAEFREIYDNPQSILKAEDDMPPPIHIRGTASRSELLKVFERWDVIERLYICKSSEVSPLDRCEIFAVAKDLEKDRQILHRKRRNQREYHQEGASRNLPHGVLLCQLHLSSDEVAVCSVDDVRDFYHAYEASEERAKSSPVGPTLRFGEVKHLKACQRALEAGRIDPSDELVACFKGLGMGDHGAVDIAQESHVNLLKAHGALEDSETLDYKKPIPVSRSGFYEGIMIDDHLGIQILKRKGSIQATLKQPGRDQRVFEQSDQAYSEVGLEAHPGKKVRRALDTRVWGAQIEGCKGLVGPTRTRLVRLAKLSTVAALPGAMDEKVLEAITGQWAFCAQFRRPLFSMMHALYHQGNPGNQGGLFLMSREARNELIMLAILAPLCITDLRVPYSNDLFCVDASPSGAGVCKVRVKEALAKEMWRRGDKLGYRIPLLTSLESWLKTKGCDEDDLLESPQEVWEEVGEKELDFRGWLNQSTWGQEVFCRRPLYEQPVDFLEMYSGCSVMTSCFEKAGCSVLPPLELKKGFDLRDQKLFWGVLSFVRAGKVRFVWWAPPCTTFSLARCPKLRSLFEAWGFDLLNLQVVLGNLHALQCFLVAWAQLMVGHWFAGEQPAYGFMRATFIWELLARIDNVIEVLFDWCRFGRNYVKTTRLLTNVSSLKQLGVRCCHGKRGARSHEVLKGAATTAAGAYSQVFCERVAKLVQQFLLIRSADLVENTSNNRGDTPQNPPKAFRERRSRPKGGSALWAVQLSEGLNWKTWIQYSFQSREHINLQETKARRSMFKRLGHGMRLVVCQDSRVNLGSLGKGRSPSKALNRLLRTEAPYILGKNLYVSSVHFPTWSIRADGPSRGRKVESARTALPRWFWKVSAGDHEAKEQLDFLQGLPRAFNRWFFMAGALLLRVSCRRTATPSGAATRQRDAGKRSHHRTNRNDEIRSIGPASSMVGGRTSTVQFGGLGSTTHRQFVRVLRRIYHWYVRRRTHQTSSSRNSQCGGSTFWLAKVISCRAMESAENMGHFGTGSTPSADSTASPLCSCDYCLGLGMASLCGPYGSGIFCFAETLRAYWAAACRLGFTIRSLGDRRNVCKNWESKNSVQRSQGSTCSSGRAGHIDLVEFDASFFAALETYLAGFPRLFQEAIRASSEGSLA